MNTLSVITATIPGREHYLRTALESVSAQSFPVKEHIVKCGDPGDTPSPLHQAQQLNACLEVATGDFVAVLDDDNEWLPDHAAALMVMSEMPFWVEVGMYPSVVYSFDRPRDPKSPYLPRVNVNTWEPERLIAQLDKQNVIDGGASAMRRRDLLEIGGFPTDWVGGKLNWNCAEEAEHGHFTSGVSFADWETYRLLAHARKLFVCVPVSTWVYNARDDSFFKRMQTGLG